LQIHYQSLYKIVDNEEKKNYTYKSRHMMTNHIGL